MTGTGDLAMREERQYRWEPLNEPPEGWRRCDYRDLDDDGTLHVLWTDAPPNENPHLHNVFWQVFQRITQRRYVTPWEDEGGGPHEFDLSATALSADATPTPSADVGVTCAVTNPHQGPGAA